MVYSPAVSTTQTRGLFITLEGLDGTGKSTQLALLAEWLRQRGRTVRVTEEPGGTPLGLALRELIQHDRETPPVPRAELFLFLAARAQHVDALIRPALERGEVVLCSRFSHSTLAYQIHGLELDDQAVRDADRFAAAGLLPDRVLIFDADPAAAAARRDARSHPDRIEDRAAAFHRRVRDGFRALAAADPQRLRLIDAEAPIEAVQAACRAAIEDLL